MAKDPAFLFYPNDWIGGTMGMTFEEKGAYMELLMMQFNRGHMTEHMIGQIVGQLWVNIKDKFIKDDAGLFYNKRLDEEKEKRKAFTESRRNNISGTNQFTKKEAHKKGHMTNHMENENENEDVNVIINEIYNFYPSKCPIGNRSTGKCTKNKEKIGKLLKEKTKDQLINIIDWYIKNCTETKTYIKNFSTFLNNLPDLPEIKPEIKSKQISKHELYGGLNPEYAN